MGALLLERILPGDDLNSVPSLSEQVVVAGGLICNVPLPIQDVGIFPTYRNWMDRALAKTRFTNVPNEVHSLLGNAEEFYRDIELLKRPDMLLHGDLHHWNILHDRGGQWRAIDPHGVIGPAFMECARFMNNHLCRVEGQARLAHLDNMISYFSEAFGESKQTISQGFFVLSVLSVCWICEEANPDKGVLQEAIEECQFILKYIRKLGD